MCSRVVHRIQKQHHTTEEAAQTKDFTTRLLQLRHSGSLDWDLVNRHRSAAKAEALRFNYKRGCAATWQAGGASSRRSHMYVMIMMITHILL